MAQFDTPQIGYTLNINGEYHNTLDIESFSQMMKDPSYCYKFYWLEAIDVYKRQDRMVEENLTFLKRCIAWL